MDLSQVAVKFYLAEPDALDQDALIPVFHRWIREGRLDDKLLIDVADYRHVHEGPGVMIIADEGHYAVDAEGGQLGVLYGRKRDPLGPAAVKVREAVVDALQACVALEGEAAVDARVATDRVRIKVLDRRVADDQASSDAIGAAISDVLAAAYGGAAPTVTRHDDDGRGPLTFDVVGGGADRAETLLGRLRPA